jgi:hypothetical protein
MVIFVSHFNVTVSCCTVSSTFSGFTPGMGTCKIKPSGVSYRLEAAPRPVKPPIVRGIKLSSKRRSIASRSEITSLNGL